MNNKLSGLFSNARTKYIIMTAAVLILLAGAYFAWKTYFRENPQLVKWNETTAAASTQTSTFDLSTVKIEPVTSDSAGVDTKSAFKLYCDAGLTPETIQAALRVTPERAYSLEKVSRGEYNISFKDELTGNSVYKLEMTDSSSGSKRSWAFQTKRSFSVVRTLPRNQATQVPVDSGIEITFSQENAESLENYFEISPKVEGRFETHKKTIVFVPKQLEPGTIYTVTIKKGIGFSGSTDKLAEDYSFSFQTTVKEPEEIRLQFSFTNELYNFTAKATPALQVYADSTLNNTDADLELYKYQDEALFEADMKAYDLTPRWALRESTEVPASLEKLQKLQISKAKIVEHQEKNNLQTYLLLPDTLEEGSYLVKASVGGDTVYTWLQISNSVAYIMVANNKTIAWVNDSVTGKPLQNAVITSDYYPSAKTDATGIARLDGALDKPDAANLYFKLSVEGRPDFIARVSQNAYPYYMAGSYYYGGNSSNSTNIYWTYQYLDKDVYLPTDRINIWGVVKKRDGSALDAGNTQAGAVLELTRSDYYNDFYYTEGGSKTVIDSKEVEISPNGTYTGSFSLEAYNPGSYNVSLKVNGEIVSGNYIQIMEYVKPAYKLELTPDKKAVFAGDKVNLGIQASFFEGSPLPGLKLNYSTGVSSNSPKEGQVTCDNNGYYSLTLPTETAITSWRPQSLFAELSSANAEETDIRAYTYLNVFPRDTMFEASGKIEKGMAIVDFKTNLIDLTRLNEEGDYNWDSELYRGAAVDKALSVRLIETHYEAEETGSYYDYINKKTVKLYRYNEVNNLLQEFAVNTVKGEYRLEFPANEKYNYRLEISGYDSKGRLTTDEAYIYSWMGYYFFNNRGYTMVDENGKSSYRTGDEVALKMKDSDNQDMPQAPNYSYLYVRMKNGVLDYVTSDKSSYSFTAGAEIVPDMFVKAVCFDGSEILDAQIKELDYDRQEKALEIKVTPDKAMYRPGDTVKLAVEVKDESGAPAGSEVNVSVVDEAFFAISNQYVNTLASLYSTSVSSGLISEFSSHVPLDSNSYSTMAEGGEGGDMAVRSDFRDSALFGSVETGADGKGEISFKLPDNLTSWRVTCQSVTGDLKAGNTKINVSAKLPFFADTVFNKVFITGDSPALLVRAYGTELKPDGRVDYSVTVENASGYKKQYTASATGNSLAQLQLDKLEKGTYTYTAEATSGSLKDALKKEFKVVDSLLETGRSKQYQLKEGLAIEGGKSLTTLTFINREAAEFYNELYSLYWSFGERIDQKLSRKAAGELLKKYFNEDNITDENTDFSKYQLSDGGLALLSYDSSNPELSAEICAAAPGVFDEAALKSYFYGIIGNTESTAGDVSAAYWGLAALQEPVLLEIRSLLADADSSGLGIIEKLELANGLAAIGDDQGAGEVYREIMDKYAKQAGGYTIIDTSSGRDETSKATALGASIALKINAPEKLQLFGYSKSNSTDSLLTNLERLIFVNSYLPGVQTQAGFTYSLDGKEEKVALEKGNSFRLDLTPEKLKNIKFNGIQGEVTVTASYTAPVKDLLESETVKTGEALTDNGGKLITLTREYNGNSGSNVSSGNSASVVSFDRSGLIMVTITPTFSQLAPDGMYEVTDILPSGFRFVRASPPTDSAVWYLDEVSGQKVVFGYNYADKKTRSITYYAMAVLPGTYTADNTFMKLVDMDAIFGSAEKATLTVKGGIE